MKTNKYFLIDSFKFGLRNSLEHIMLFCSCRMSMLGIYLSLFVFDILTFVYFWMPSHADLSLQEIFSIYLECWMKYFNEIMHAITTKDLMYLAYLFKVFFIYNWYGIVILAIIFIVAILGYIRISLDIYDNKKTSLKRFFSNFYLIPKALIVSFIYLTIGLLGTMLFIVPDVIWVTRSYFCLHFIVDKNSGIIESFKKSFELTKGFSSQTFGWILITFILSAPLYGIPFIYRILGSLILAAIYSLSLAFLYRSFEKKENPDNLNSTSQ